MDCTTSHHTPRSFIVTWVLSSTSDDMGYVSFLGGLEVDNFHKRRDDMTSSVARQQCPANFTLNLVEIRGEACNIFVLQSWDHWVFLIWRIRLVEVFFYILKFPTNKKTTLHSSRINSIKHLTNSLFLQVKVEEGRWEGGIWWPSSIKSIFMFPMSKKKKCKKKKWNTIGVPSVSQSITDSIKELLLPAISRQVTCQILVKRSPNETKYGIILWQRIILWCFFSMLTKSSLIIHRKWHANPVSFGSDEVWIRPGILWTCSAMVRR